MPPGGDLKQRIGLPYRPFLFTLDQIAGMLDVELQTLTISMVYFDGRSTGLKTPNKMLARNIAMPKDKPDWRVAERELLRWMKKRGFRHYESTRLLS